MTVAQRKLPPWDEATQEKALDWVRAHGNDLNGLAAHMGMPRQSVSNRVQTTLGQRYRAAVAAWRLTPEGVGAQHARLVEDATARVERLQQAWGWLAPVELPPLTLPRVTAKPNPFGVVTSDHHWPLHDPRAEAIVLQVLEALRPSWYALNGDGPDLLALSKHPKDARKGKQWPLSVEQQAAKSWWRAVAQATAACGTTLYEIEANHSGNGTASRWRRWLNENAAPLFTLDGFEADCTYQRYFHDPAVPVTMVEELVVASDLRIRHGELARGNGGYSAKAHREKWGSSVLHGHTHRIGSSTKRRPGLPGVRADEYLRSYETGCMCAINADYAPGADWVQGFSVVCFDEGKQTYEVQQVHIIDGAATVPVLGVTFHA